MKQYVILASLSALYALVMPIVVNSTIRGHFVFMNGGFICNPVHATGGVCNLGVISNMLVAASFVAQAILISKNESDAAALRKIGVVYLSLTLILMLAHWLMNSRHNYAKKGNPYRGPGLFEYSFPLYGMQLYLCGAL